MSAYLDQIKSAAGILRARISETPKVGLVLGSGWGTLLEGVSDAIHIPYGDIPNMRTSTVLGHAGEWIFGRIGDTRVVVMSGRLHYYEGYSMKEITLPIRIMKELGCEIVILTNAAGAVNTFFQPGDLMLINDHVNFVSNNPLIGPNEDTLGERFFDMTHAYDPELIALSHRVARAQDFTVRDGVYGYLTGPCFETPAEIRYLRAVGVDAVGMSTVPEVIVARHAGMRVLAFSCLTNMAAGILEQPLSHKEVIAMSQRVRPMYTRFLAELMRSIK